MSRHTLRVNLLARGQGDYYLFHDIFFPASIVDGRGEVLGAGAISSDVATEFAYERGGVPLFARMALPNGTTQTQPLRNADGSWRNEVTFRIGDEADVSEWMAWSVARLDNKRQGGTLQSLPGMVGAWFQLWEKGTGAPRWRQIHLDHGTDDLHVSPEAIQMDFRRSHLPRALVVRLDSDSPETVSLPPWPTKVLVTTLRTLSGAVKPKVVVGGYSANAETIMEYLRASRLGAVEALLDPGSELAHRLLQDKVADPVAATAAAYYLLRKRDWDRMPDRWLRNLEHWFEEIPDARLIRAMSSIERGMPMADAADLAVNTLSHFLRRGFPVFSEATWLLGDLLALAETAEQRPLESRTRRTLRTLLAASRPAGLSFGFAGKAPNRPMSAKEAFELRQKQRGDQLLSEAVQEVFGLVDAAVPRLPPVVLGDEPASRQLRVAFDRLRTGMAVLQTTTQPVVPGNASKTLFLREVLNVGG